MQANASYFSAVVVSFHTGPVLNQCLTALLEAPLCGEIVLVNNSNSRDVTTALTARARTEPKLTLIDGHGNIGFGSACNLGAEMACYSLLVFVNPDCVIDKDTLPALGDALAHSPDALVGGSLRNEDGSEQRGCRRGELTPWSALISFLGLGRAGPEAGILRDFNRTGEPLPSMILDMPVVSGALMALRASTFKKVGGFDPAFFLHVEDIDLCQRIRKDGGTVLFVPQATALHIGATSAVPSWSIERAKIASFGHYFWKNAHTFSDYVGVVSLMPVLAAAVVLRKVFARPS